MKWPQQDGEGWELYTG